jgi:hypothetical protein
VSGEGPAGVSCDSFAARLAAFLCSRLSAFARCFSCRFSSFWRFWKVTLMCLLRAASILPIVRRISVGTLARISYGRRLREESSRDNARRGNTIREGASKTGGYVRGIVKTFDAERGIGIILDEMGRKYPVTLADVVGASTACNWPARSFQYSLCE